jgi:acyl phosphate:glycerol-3-phosphate acyltransferase
VWPVLGLLVGYLCGSVSFTRIVARLTSAPALDGAAVVDGTGRHSLARVSPTSLGAVAGKRWGLTAAGLEVLKAAIPTWLFRRLLPGSGAAEAAMVGAVAGHTAPVFHRFRGGYGQSPLLGAMLVLDPWSVPVAVAASTALGVATADDWVAQDTWPLALLPWAAWRGDTRLAAGVVGAVAIYVAAIWPDTRRHLAQRPAGPWRERIVAAARGFGTGKAP